jgi:predicted enzyme related to lactoylglutathione lyase
MPRVVHFEIAADDPQRAAAFYSEVFGWRIQKWDGPVEYWLVQTGESGPGIDGGLMRRAGAPGPVVNTVDVDDVEDAIARITRVGGKVLSPKQAIPGIGWFAYCQDTEGNPFGIMQSDPSAT